MKVIQSLETSAQIADMKIGQLGTISYLGNAYTVLRVYKGLVALEDPSLKWEEDTKVLVRLLPPGTRITLESEV